MTEEPERVQPCELQRGVTYKALETLPAMHDLNAKIMRDIRIMIERVVNDNRYPTVEELGELWRTAYSLHYQTVGHARYVIEASKGCAW